LKQKEGMLSLNIIEDIRKELDEHLSAINDNTGEIETNYTYLISLDKRMRLIEKKLALFEKMLSPHLKNFKNKEERKKIKLDDSEKLIFQILYEAENALDYQTIMIASKKSKSTVKYCIDSMINKNIPIQRHIINKRAFFLLEPEFKEIQAKNNIVNVKTNFTLDCFDQDIL